LRRSCTSDLPHSQSDTCRGGGGEKISPRWLRRAAHQCLTC
jgi:hypothetical protein